jgi:hypothetical protein
MCSFNSTGDAMITLIRTSSGYDLFHAIVSTIAAFMLAPIAAIPLGMLAFFMAPVAIVGIPFLLVSFFGAADAEHRNAVHRHALPVHARAHAHV